jgi:transcriptional regulator with XRE-family HTH domain
MKTLGDRVRARRKQLRLTQTQAADLVGMSQGGWSGIETGDTKDTKGTNITAIAAALKTTARWLQTGEGHPDERDDVPTMQIETPDGVEVCPVIFMLQSYQGDKPVIDRSVSMPVPRWMSDRFEFGPTTTLMHRLQDNAAAPDRPKDTIVLIDTAQREPVDAGLYCVRLLGVLTVRRIFIEPDGALRIACDNPNKTQYPDKLIAGVTADYFYIVGAVVARFDM